jgi:hypothetical protein
MEKKKKIGILTCHRFHNFGSLLQAYALKHHISSIGYSVEFIDYWPKYHEIRTALWNWELFFYEKPVGKIKMLANIFLFYFRRKKNQRFFGNFIDTYIKPMVPVADGCYEVVVCGSDQIWRYRHQALFQGYNEVYFGNIGCKVKRLISYAASMETVLQDTYTVSFFQKNLKNFNAISVRESDLQKFVQSLTPLRVFHAIDPVFLLSKEQWNILSLPSLVAEKYILLYNLLKDKTAAKLAKEIARKKGFSIVTIRGGGIPGKLAGPREFLSYIKHAECVISSSFHGVAFSIIYQKEFYASLKEHKRVSSLLDSLGLGDRLVSDIPKTLKPINYEVVNEKLRSRITDSTQWLETNLQS